MFFASDFFFIAANLDKLIHSMAANLAKLETQAGYSFNDLSLLERALTHRSWAYEKMPSGSEAEIRDLHNETFEFVGDSVLGLAVAEYLFNKNPKATEGDLTLMKHRLVSTSTLAKLAAKLGLGDYIRLGRGEEKSGGRKKQALLADAFEALIAAVFLDSGYIAARAFIHRMLAEEFRQTTPTSSLDYKTLFQETMQAGKKPAPDYQVVRHEGPPHERIFFVSVAWEGGIAEGSGSSIKNAEMEAARRALETLNTVKA